jgi:phosphoribosylamine--glycine ligase
MENTKINILLLGSGGREHALAWKIKESERCQQLFIAPGNAGTRLHGLNVPLSLSDFNAIKTLVLKEDIKMVIVGPEEPLVKGIVDFFEADSSLSHVFVVGPSAKGAQLEGSKAFAKEFMAGQSIPTAAYQAFTSETLAEGLVFLSENTGPYVLKADGLAAGKGVVILTDVAEAKAELIAMLSGKFGAASSCVVIEQFLSGIEFSVFALTDGSRYILFPEAKDYKKVGEADTGLNTGGMGAISPVPFFDATMIQKVKSRIIEPTLKGLQENHISYKGFIFFGLISVEGEPFVIEYNCRLGDPETEAIIPRLKSDIVTLFFDLHNQSLGKKPIEIDERFAATIMLVSGGYPGEYESNLPITLPTVSPTSFLFHAGTGVNELGEIITKGGRVLAITSLDLNKKKAEEKSRVLADQIFFKNKYYRKDIGFDL